MNFQKLKKAITDLGVSRVCNCVEDGYYNEDDDLEEDEEDSAKEAAEKKKTLAELANLASTLILVHSFGGHSGGGETVERVFAHRDKQETIYVRVTGFYSSYEGIGWDDDVERVMPETIISTVYNKYKK